MGKYLKKFNTHGEYEESIDELVLPNVSICDDNKTNINHVHYNPYKKQIYALKFEAEQNCSIGFTATDNNTPNFEISFDGETWKEWDFVNEDIDLLAGDILYIRGNNPNGIMNSINNEDTCGFTSNFNERIIISGDIMSLISYEEKLDTIPSEACFADLFSSFNQGIYNIKLPAINLTPYCYAYMFSGNFIFGNFPKLPATKLKPYCYAHMFEGTYTTEDNNLEITLPAPHLVEGCYNGMFYDCDKLNKITCLAEYIGAEDCLTEWVDGVASEGTFKCASGMEDVFTRGTDGIPVDWVVTN